jgi:phospholipid/cholesterol/gamma-HCH transport system ATP-binding protein
VARASVTLAHRGFLTGAVAVALIDLQDVGMRFDGETVLRDVTLSVDEGESVVVIGPSGCGKTVLLKLIVGVYQPTAGSVRVGGGRRIGMLFQKSGLFDSMTNWENIAFRLLQQGHVSRAEARALAVEKLALVGLHEREADLYPADLSGGMQKRVGIARAVADDPDILVLDEPTAGLDPITSNMINDMIVDVVGRLGVTVLSVNSDMNGARRTASRAVMLFDGHAIWTGPTDTMHQSGHGHVDQFVNSRAEGPIRIAV